MLKIKKVAKKVNPLPLAEIVNEVNTITELKTQIMGFISATQYLTWSQAHSIILGPSTKFFRGNITAITAYFEKAVKGSSALIVDKKGQHHPRVHAQHAAFLRDHGYTVYPRVKEK